MFVGALLDAGAGSLGLLQAELEKVDFDGWSIATESIKASGIAATRFSVIIEGEEQGAEEPLRHRGAYRPQRPVGEGALPLPRDFRSCGPG